MAESQIAGENSFIRGLISEATGLNFPKDACTDTSNCVFDSKGTVSRRLGIDYEASANTSNTVTRSSSAVAEYTWESVAGDGTKSFVVAQIGTTLHFWNVPSSGALSANKKSFTVNLSTYVVAGASNIGSLPCQFATGRGDLFVVHPNCDPFFVSYTAGSDSITVTKITVMIRDLIGIEENIPFNVRPSSITLAHKYNLWNQGWYVGMSRTYDDEAGNNLFAERVPYEQWNTYRTAKSVDGYPSNADVWWQYKDTTGTFTTYSIKRAGKTPPATPAPKGHFLMRAFQQYKGFSKVQSIVQIAGTSYATVTLYEGTCFRNGAGDVVTIEGSSIARFNGTFTIQSVGTGNSYDTFVIPVASNTTAGTENDSDNLYCYIDNSLAPYVTAGTNRPRCVAFFAGRVFYGGTQAADFGDKIYFSKIIEQDSDCGRCYQVNDPTAEDLSDLLPSDGGVISIPDMGTMVRMQVVGQDLLIFATNGVWRLSGSEIIGFRANDYTISQISNVPAVSPDSFVIADGTPVFWNNDGIYTASRDGVQSLTDKTIKSWFVALPVSSKVNAKGVYNTLKKTIYWLYRSTASTTTDSTYEYDRVLCLNLLTGAFYPWTIGTASGYPYVNGIVVTEYIGTSGSTTKFLVTKNTSGTTYQVTFGEERDTTYVDWETPNVGMDYSSYFVTGFKVPGDGMRQEFGNYINVYCNNATNSSLKLRAKWDFANSSASGEWSSEQEVYVQRVYRDTLRRRVKLRGRGIACQLSFRSTTGKPFNAVGWAMMETVNPGP